MKTIILIIIICIILTFQGCYTRNRLVKEVKRWDKVEIVKDDSLRVWKENGVYYYQEYGKEIREITYGDVVDYLVDVFKP